MMRYGICFLIIHLSLFCHVNPDNIQGKWKKKSGDKTFDEIVFFADHKARITSGSSSYLLNYSFSNTDKVNKISGYFRVVSMGKELKRIPVTILFKNKNEIEFLMKDQKTIFQKYIDDTILF